MFKDVISGFRRVFSTQKVVFLAIAVVLSLAFLSYANGGGRWMEGMASAAGGAAPAAPSDLTPSTAGVADTAAPAPSSGLTARSTNQPSDLLPSDPNSSWSSMQPSGTLITADMLEPTALIGINTLSPARKNPNLQLRSDPIIQKIDVPWNNPVDIEPDLQRVPFEIGYGPR